MSYYPEKLKLSVLVLLLFAVNIMGGDKMNMDLIKAEVKQYKGTPMLFINGKVTAPLFFFDNMGGWGDHNLVIKELQLAKK